MMEDAIIPLRPREGEDTLRTEDILETLERYKDEVGALLSICTMSGADSGMHSDE